MTATPHIVKRAMGFGWVGWTFLTHTDAVELADWPVVFPVLVRSEPWVRPGALALYIPATLAGAATMGHPFPSLRRIAAALPEWPYHRIITLWHVGWAALLDAVEAAEEAERARAEDRALGIRPLDRW